MLIAKEKVRKQHKRCRSFKKHRFEWHSIDLVINWMTIILSVTWKCSIQAIKLSTFVLFLSLIKVRHIFSQRRVEKLGIFFEERWFVWFFSRLCESHLLIWIQHFFVPIEASSSMLHWKVIYNLSKEAIIKSHKKDTN